MTIAKFRIFCWLLCCLAAGCTDKDALSVGDTGQETVDGVSLRLSISMAGNGTDESGSRETPGTGFENNIHNLYVFTENSSGERTAYPFNNITLDEGTSDGARTVKLKLPASMKVGSDVKLYLGANLNAEQAAAFCANNQAYTLPDETSSYNIIEAFAPGIKTAGNTPREDIAMFCTKVKTATITTEKDGAHTELEVTFDLKRLVAKVLVTCEEDKNNEGYAPLKDGSSLATNGGWIRLENVYFLVNSLNRSSFIMEKENNGTWVDPNNDLEKYLDNTYGGYNASLIANDFVYAPSDLQYNVINYFKHAPKYEEAKLPGANGQAYAPAQALYCPENLFAEVADETVKKKLASYKYVWPMITHVSVAAKYTPKKLWIEKELVLFVLNKIDKVEGSAEEKKTLKEQLELWKQAAEEIQTSVMEVRCSSEYVSQTLLTQSLIKEDYYQEGTYDYDTPGFPQHTYFYYNNQSDSNIEDRYYTYGAVKLMLGDSFDPGHPENLGNYLPYTQGWGYYHTYIDDIGENQSVAPYKNGQVRRNTYYILTVKSFSHPGTSIHQGGYIDVHTRVEEWKDGGSGSIKLN